MNKGVYMEHAPITWQNEFFAGSQRILTKIAHVLGHMTVSKETQKVSVICHIF